MSKTKYCEGCGMDGDPCGCHCNLCIADGSAKGPRVNWRPRALEAEARLAAALELISDMLTVCGRAGYAERFDALKGAR